MNVITQLIPKNRQTQRPGLRLEPTFITIHSTGNPNSTAKNEADYVCYNSKSQASFHYVVGENEIYQVLPDNEVGWHAGDGYNGTGNRKSIGVEIIETGNRETVLLNAISLVEKLMSTYNIPLINIVPHRHWSKKNCPRILIDNSFIKNSLNWEWFIEQLPLEPLTLEKAYNIIAEKADLENVSIEALKVGLKHYRYYEELILSLARAML